MADRILILGVSARAAAASARRAGLEPFCIDLFADRDTHLLADCLRCPPEEYPRGLFRLAKQAPPMPWMYTGGLENYPELIDALAKERTLFGNESRQIRSVRDPYRLFAILTAHDIRTPFVSPAGPPAPFSGPWLIKRYRGSGGKGIAHYDYDPGSPRSGYIQQYIPGGSMSAVFAAMPWRVSPLATTRQLIGESWLHAGKFQYCGNIGPCSVEPDITERVRSIGQTVTQYGPKFGLYGVDYIENDSEPWVIEVNPRYPASVEVIEYACRASLLKWHVDFTAVSGNGSKQDWAEPSPLVRHSVVGKAIYYAPHRLTVPASGPWDESLRHVLDVWRRPDFADIPNPGDVIEAGQPVLTILAEAATEEACLTRLKSRAAELNQLLIRCR